MTRTQERGFTLIELLIVVAIIGILAAVAVPGLQRARQAGNEASAIGSLRAVNSGQLTYVASCGNGFYARTLEVLADPADDASTAFISPDLGTSGITKNAYTMTMTGTPAPGTAPASCNGGELSTGYHATATPVAGGSARGFGTNTTGTIFVNASGAVVVTDTAVTTGTPLR